MTQDPYQILLIEDDSATATMVENYLGSSTMSPLAARLPVQITAVSNLAEAVEVCQDREFAIVLLDLFLSEIQGIDTLIKARTIFPDQSIIAYSQSEDEHLVIQAFQHGADGYLRLKNLDSYLLYYELLSVLERNIYRRKSENQRNLASQQKEYHDLETLISSTTSVTARMFGSDTIKDSFPELFEELKQSYGELLELALDQRAFRIDHNLSGRLRNLADRLGFMKASPRDIIEIHTTTLKEKNHNINVVKSQAYAVEGRLILLELMGYLAGFYRKYYVSLNNLNISSRISPRFPPKDSS
ncbi:response regulator [Synechocystis sp. FACHB-383]|uniref:response regulator n=1 Tax=Synechocystis sp. FACHB-383 TaxID=2692864 RepID=UPI001681FFA2|nr:response regulator [Synechocystis sp. FACHB-383]MBD2653281.1 response regulator [Synechocystis sp. FACHB-383]